MIFPLHIESKLISPGYSNDNYGACISFTYFQGQQVIAYGSANKVVIASNSLTIMASLTGHAHDSHVTAVAWAQFSGKLSSCGTDLKMNIWQPVKNGWQRVLSISIMSEASCISWNYCDTKFCVAADEFTLYNFETIDKKTNAFEAQKIFIESTKTKYCAFSRDSRFILTLQENNREIIIWNKKSNSKGDYRRLALLHPSTVISISWRLAEDVYERCCFMSIAQDGIVRIWMETGVNEPLLFNVVASIRSPSEIIAGCFLITTSKMLNNNPSFFLRNKKRPYLDNYAYGNGHLQIRDRNSRQTNVPDPREITRNRSWLITFDRSQKLTIHELSGLSLSVRKTPKLTTLGTITVPQVPASGSNLFYSTCRLESELGHLENPKFEGRPSMISLIIQNSMTHTITTADIVMGKSSNPVSILGILKGHRWKIKFIRIHESQPYMMTIDERKTATFWQCDDSDVFDSSVLITFMCTLGFKIVTADFIMSSSRVVAFDGKSILVFSLPTESAPIYRPETTQISTNFKESQDKLIDFRILAEISGSIYFIALFLNAIHVCILKKNDLQHLLYKKLEKHDRFTSGSMIYVAKILPIKGAPLYIVSTKNKVGIIQLVDEEGGVSYNEHFSISDEEEEIISVSHSRPASIFVVTTKNIYAARQVCSKFGSYELLEKYTLDSRPTTSSCLPNGLLAVAFEKEVKLFFHGRQSHEFTQSCLVLNMAASIEAKNVSVMEWIMNGILIYSSEGQLFALTKFMDTFFLESCRKLPTIHHSLVHLRLSVPDLHSNVFVPLAISGRLNLLSKMIKYFDINFETEGCRTFFKKYILAMPSETDIEGNHLISKSLLHHIESLKMKIRTEEALYNDKEDDFADMAQYRTQTAKKTEDQRLLYILDNIYKVVSIPFEELDQRGLVYLRAVIFSQKMHIPFDLVCCAAMSHEKAKLLSLINTNEWETIDRCGIVFWCDLEKIEDLIVPMAVKEFDNHRYISIFFLVLFKRFKALHLLFSSAGDDTRAAFFTRNFTNSHNKKSALNNAYSALSKQDFHIAAAMFILAGNWENALRISIQNINDLSLSFLLTYFSGNRKMFSDYVEEYLIQQAKEKNDLSALALFEFIAFNKEIDLTMRMRQAQPGFFYQDARIFGDTRFCAVEVLHPTTENFTDLANSLILAGQFFLASQFLNKMNTFELSQDLKKNLKTSRSYQFNETSLNLNISQSINNGLNKISAAANRRASNDLHERAEEEMGKKKRVGGCLVTSRSMRLNNKTGTQNELIPNRKIKVSKSPYLFTTKISTDDEEDEEVEEEDVVNPLLIEINTKNDNENEDENEDGKYNTVKSEELFGFGANNIDDDFIDDDFDDDFSDEDDENKDNDDENKNLNKGLNKNLDKNDDSTYEEAESTSSQLTTSFYTIMITFNIARLRLEMYIEHTNTLSEVEKTIPEISKDLAKSGAHLASLAPQLNDFLIRSCKRCSFVFRRLLLLTDRASRFEYLLSLCVSLSSVPNHIAANLLTSQQVAQISLTLMCLMTSINTQKFESFAYFRFVIASIATGLFVVGCYTHNDTLLLLLLKQNLKVLKEFPIELIALVDVEIVPPEKVNYKAKRSQLIHCTVEMISKEDFEIFSYNSNNVNIDKTSLCMFMSPMFDMMLIDDFMRQIMEFNGRNMPEFQKLLATLKKMHDLYIQLFTYATLNFPVILKISSLKDIVISKASINELYKFLLGRNDRVRVLPSFCRNILSRFSDINPHHFTSVSETMSLKMPQRIAHFQGGISSFSMYDDKIIAATGQGIREAKINEKTIDIESEDANSSGSVVEDIVLVEEPPFIIDSESALLNNDVETTPDTMPRFNFVPDFKYPKHPRIIVSHPNERYCLISDCQGRIYAQNYDSNKKIVCFQTIQMTKCTALSFANGGTMFAAAHENMVSIYSLCHKDSVRPFARYDSYGSSVRALTFIQGTGIFATCQMPSENFDANIVFWDSILAPGTAMISSLKVEKVGRPTSICFSPKYHEVVVGTGKGSLILIDTRKYEILKILKAHERGIYTLKIDQNESYCVTGGGEGAVKIWDMRTMEKMSELNLVHSSKMVKESQKWRTFAISDITIKGDTIYTAGVDGNINKILFN